MREFQRAAVRLHILHHAADNEVHGAWLTQELSRHGYRVSPGTLYPTLHRLEADGLLVSEQRVVDGRAHRSPAAPSRPRCRARSTQPTAADRSTRSARRWPAATEVTTTVPCRDAPEPSS